MSRERATMFDYHTHSSFSADSTTPMEKICETAMELGLKEICFTEHVDLDYPSEELDFRVDFAQYNMKISEVREKFPHLGIKKGIEAGFQSHTIQSTYNLLKEQDLDFIISSVHLVNGQDPYFPEYFQGQSKKEAYGRYLDKVLESVTRFEYYSVLGHLGYVTKGAPYEDKVLYYRDFPDEIDAILKTVLSTGHGIEVNTSGLRYCPSPLPGLDILKRYRELGGEIITLGSDGHYIEYLAYKFPEATALLKEAGFRYITVFHAMKPSFVKL